MSGMILYKFDLLLKKRITQDVKSKTIEIDTIVVPARENGFY